MGAAAYNRGSKHIRGEIDREQAKNQRERDLFAVAERMRDERDAAREGQTAQQTEITTLRNALAAAQATIAAQTAEIAALTEARDLAVEQAERAPAHYKHLWQVERAGYQAACRRYQQLKTIVLNGMSREDWELARTEAQAYYPHVDWTGIETMKYPRPPLFGYRMPEAKDIIG